MNCTQCGVETDARTEHEQHVRLVRAGLTHEEIAAALPCCPECVTRLLVGFIKERIPEVETAARLLVPWAAIGQGQLP